MLFVFGEGWTWIKRTNVRKATHTAEKTDVSGVEGTYNSHGFYNDRAVVRRASLQSSRRSGFVAYFLLVFN